MKNVRSIDVSLSELILPGPEKGPEIAFLVQDKFPTCDTILMSGYSRGEVNAANAKAASIPVINKPFPQSDLARKIQLLLS